MVRNIDHASRKKSVLGATINRYIKNPLPVASEDVSDLFSLSSSTIRNIFAELEDEGLLTHPHTSAGRVPTNKGYRYYVDVLLSQAELLDDEKQRIIKEYKKEIRELDEALENTSEVISAITHYTSIVSFLEWEDKLFYNGISFVLEQPEFHDHKRISFLIRMIEQKEKLLNIINRDFSGKIKIYIGDEIGFPEIDNCSLVVSTYNVKKRPIGRLAILGPMRMEYEHIIPTLGYVSDYLTEILEKI